MLLDLNEVQKKAATTIDHHVRIIAGAGSGKTRVITYRIAYLINVVGIPPKDILAITFTNKAANEMKERLKGLLNTEYLSSTVCTIHSLCVRILREYIYLINYPRFFVIMDTEDQRKVLKDIYKELGVQIKQISYTSAINYISSCKCAKVSVEKAKSLAGDFIGEKKKALIYEKYLEYQEKNKCLDFDDLLLKTEYIFEHFDFALESWQQRFSYIHVDEFQDVSDLEYNIVRFLTGTRNILCVVGDPDQTIYSFRGADVNYILDLEQDYPNIETVMLNENYRSTKSILATANNLIAHNELRIKKDLFTNGNQGDKVIHCTLENDKEEAEYVVAQINQIINTVEGVNYHDFAILYRANYLSRAIEQELIKNDMTYRIFGGIRFTDRKEIKDVLSYLRAFMFKDDLSIERIANVPARSVGERSFEKVKNYANIHNMSYYDVIKDCLKESGVTGKAKKGLTELMNLLIEFESVYQSKTIPEIIEYVIDETGYKQMLLDDEDEQRVQNIEELKNMANDYMIEYSKDEALIEFLLNIPLGSNQDDVTDEEFISLMTVHMSKGLEFNYVFVIGLSDDVFPSARAITETGKRGEEEERRLAYVAFTRAKRKLFLTENNGFSFVTQSNKSMSRFIQESGIEEIEHEGIQAYNHFDITYFGNKRNSDYQEDDVVEHDTFGQGVVISVNDEILTIAFAYPIGVKKIMKNHQALKKVIN